MPSSSSAAAAQADTFSPLHLPLLTLIAVCAAQCVQYRSTEECLDSLFSTPVAHSSESDLPPQKAFQGTENATEDDASVTLSLLYPEVRVLECVHHIRSDLRKLQECPEHARKNLTEVLVTHVDELCQIIPDPLFGALALATRSQVSEEPLRDGEAVLTKPQRCLLERQTLQVVEKLQQEVLAQSHGLTTRCTALTLRYQHHVPF